MKPDDPNAMAAQAPGQGKRGLVQRPFAGRSAEIAAEDHRRHTVVTGSHMLSFTFQTAPELSERRTCKSYATQPGEDRKN